MSIATDALVQDLKRRVEQLETRLAQLEQALGGSPATSEAKTNGRAQKR